MGGGNSAGQAAVFLSRHRAARAPAGARRRPRGQHVALPDPAHRGEPDHHAAARTPQIEALEGDGRLERVRWRDATGGTSERRDIRHVFSMTGADAEHRLARRLRGARRAAASSRPARTSPPRTWRRRGGRCRARRYLLETSLPRRVRGRRRPRRAASSAWPPRWARARPRSSSSTRSWPSEPRGRSGLRDGRDAGRRGRRPRGARGHHLLVLQPELPRAVRRRSRALSRAPRAAVRPGPARLHVPHAPGGAPGRTRELPQVRHGARAAGGHRGRRGPEPRARRHDPAVLGEPGADRARALPGDGGDVAARLVRARSSRRVALDPARCWRRRSCCGAAGRSS